MDLLIYENLTEDQIKILNDLTQKFSVDVKSIDDVQTEQLQEYNNIFLFTTLVFDFLSEKSQNLILSSTDYHNKTLQIIIVKDYGTYSKIVSDWIDSLSSKYGKKIELFTEFNNETFKEDIKFFVQSQTTSTKSKNMVTIYTDGACSHNPGPGGWGVYISYGSHKKQMSGFEKETSNNRMELTAVIKALSCLKRACKIELYSDSAYVVNAIEQNWLDKWKTNNWYNSDREHVKNKDLWKQLDELLSYHSVKFIKVKGHADNEFNNLVDKLATQEIAKNTLK